MKLFCFLSSHTLEFYTNLIRSGSLRKGYHSVPVLGLSKGEGNCHPQSALQIALPSTWDSQLEISSLGGRLNRILFNIDIDSIT